MNLSSQELSARYLDRAFTRSTELPQKTVTVQIADEDLQTLKASDYRMCFAKESEGVFDVVWRAFSDYLTLSFFDWIPDYQLFCTNVFEDGETIRSTTNIVDIEFGQQSVLDAFGLLSPASSGGNESSINLVNEYGTTHPALSQWSKGIAGVEESTPTYVSETEMIKGERGLSTVDVVLVWFEQGLETSTLFSTPRSNSFEADLSSVDRVDLLFENQQWSLLDESLDRPAAAATAQR